MTLRRILNGVSSSSPSPPPSTASPAPGLHHVNSDFVVILAALLCALICVLGLVAVARCAWFRLIAELTAASAQPSSAVTNRGLKKKALNSLPKLTYAQPSSSGDGAACGKFSVDCSICLAEYVPGDEIRLLPQCGHVFHVGCVDTWLKSHSSCPSCREHILEVDKVADAAARCHKCRELPPASSSSAATVSGMTATSSRPYEINILFP